MGSVWLTDTADWLRAAGLNVVEVDGWQGRARSSGGYEPGRPWCVMWHHTASTTDPASDCHYMCHVADARPVANVLIARDGAVWLMAAGATNTNGKGHSMTFSRGTVPNDSMNSYAFGIEIANGGTGENYPQAQVDATFVVSNTINARLGNRPSDVSTHQFYAPDRKIDPAMGGYNVEGTWHPRECTNAGSWLVEDLRTECNRRSNSEQEGFLMALTEQEQRDLYDRVMGSLPGPYSTEQRALDPPPEGRLFALDNMDGNYIVSMLQMIAAKLGIE